MANASSQAGNQAQTLTGARAKLYVNGKLVGLGTDCSWSLPYGMEPVHTLGRYEPQEIVPVSQEAIEVSVNGMRVIDFGPHKGFNGSVDTAIMVPVLADLLNNKDITIEIIDRQTNKSFMRVAQCRSRGYSSQVGAKGMVTYSMQFIGIRATDEHSTDSQIKDSTAVPYTIS